MKPSEALIKLQIFLFSDGSESNIFVKVLNQIQEEEWLCRLEEVPAEVQKRFKNIFKQKILTRSSEINVDPKLRLKLFLRCSSNRKNILKHLKAHLRSKL